MKRIIIILILTFNIFIYQFSLLHCQTWKALMDSTKYYEEKQDFQTALQWAKLALPQAEKEFGETDTNYVSSLNSMAEMFAQLGKLDSAIYYGSACLKICRSIFKEDNLILAAALSELSMSYTIGGDSKQSEPLAIEALEMRKRIFKGDNILIATSLQNLGGVYYNKGDFTKAEPLFKEGLEMQRRTIKGDNLELAKSIGNMGILYNGIGDFKQAEPLFKESLEMLRRLTKGDDPELARSINNLGMLYETIGDFKQAEPLYKESLEMNRRLFKSDHPNLAASINNLGTFYYNSGDFKQAETLWQESLDMRKRMSNGDLPDLASSLNNMALIYYKNGDYKKAEQFHKEALEMKRRIFKGDQPGLASGINNMAFFYENIGDFKQAESLYIEALEMNRRLYKGDHPELAGIINNLGLFYNRRGNFNQAELLFIEALEMKRRIFIGDHPDLALGVNNMAYYYSGRGDSKHAEPLYKEALEMYRRIYKGDNPELATCIGNMASIYWDRGDYKQAELYYKENLEMTRRIYKSDHPSLAQSINNMASFYYKRGDDKQGWALYIEALEMRRRIFKDDHPALAQSILYMAILLCKNADYKQAEPLFKEALDMTRRIFKRDHPDLAYCLNLVAGYYDRIGDDKQAESLYKESLDMRKRIFKGDNNDLAGVINDMACFYIERGNYKTAEPLLVEALGVYKNILNNYFPSLSENEKKQFWNTLSIRFEGFNSFGVSRSSDNPLIICNMYDMQLYTKALLFNSTSRVKKRIINSNDNALIEKYKELSDKKELLVKLYSMTEDTRKQKGFNIDSIEKITNDLEKELSLKSELYTQSYDKKKVTWKTIQGLLKPDEAAVEVLRFRFRVKNRFTDTIYYAFLIVTDQTEDHPDIVVLENGNLLENEYYNSYRSMIKHKIADTSSFRNYWGRLYEKLKGYKKIYFSADGIYNKLNPATLLMPDGKYMLEEKDIQQVNSTKDLLLGYYKSQQESNIYNSAVLIGNPNFSLSESLVREASQKIRSKAEEDNNFELIASTRGIELTNLPATEKEIKDIEKFLKSKKWDVNSYLGDMALKTAVKSLNSPRILHIATHGMFLEDIKLENKEVFGFETKKVIENPLLRSGLFFTGADNYLKSNSGKTSGDENGLLTAFEAMNLDLDKTELVVLSACETGLGEVRNGEGVFGLRRAFQQAGAKAVIMSLWTVDDEATQKLMSSFYKNWVTGMTKRDAFSKAQLEIKKQYKDPYYWGAFVMVGE